MTIQLAHDNPEYLCVDFDNTIVENCYPAIGPPVPGAIETLKAINRAGLKLILWTMRHGSSLRDAVGYLEKAGVELWAINENPDQHAWSHSPKAHAHIYIDDMGFGCPLLDEPGAVCEQPIVDWEAVRQALVARGVIW